MARAEPEVICLDSDSDDGEMTPTPPDPAPNNSTQSVSVLFRQGGAIDLEQLLSPEINRIIQTTPAFPHIPVLNSRSGQRLTPNRASPPANGARVKHYGNVKHLIETKPLLSVPKTANMRLVQVLPSSPILRESRMINQAQSPPQPVRQQNNHFSESNVHTGNQAARATVRAPANLQNHCFDADIPTTRPNTRSGGPTDRHLRFRCTFGGCKKAIYGDVNFVFHLWAHVSIITETCDLIEPRPQKKDPKKTTKVTVLTVGDEKVAGIDYGLRCPECLQYFHLPVQMQVHYTRVHSYSSLAKKKSTCAICERNFKEDDDGAELREHLKYHHPADCPYVCGLQNCHFRSNVRTNVITHYTEKHRNSGTLMCPFCMFSVDIAKEARDRIIPDGDSHNVAPVPISHKFVEHMWSHAMRKRLSCNYCATSMLPDPTSEVRNEHVAKHNQNCTINGYRKFLSRPKRGVLRSKIKLQIYKCRECSKQISGIVRMNEQCPECFKRSFWKRAYDRCGVKPGPLGTLYVCKCGMQTRNMDKLNWHFNMTKHRFWIEGQKPPDVDREDEKQEEIKNEDLQEETKDDAAETSSEPEPKKSKFDEKDIIEEGVEPTEVMVAEEKKTFEDDDPIIFEEDLEVVEEEIEYEDCPDEVYVEEVYEEVYPEGFYQEEMYQEEVNFEEQNSKKEPYDLEKEIQEAKIFGQYHDLCPEYFVNKNRVRCTLLVGDSSELRRIEDRIDELKNDGFSESIFDLTRLIKKSYPTIEELPEISDFMDILNTPLRESSETPPIEELSETAAESTTPEPINTTKRKEQIHVSIMKPMKKKKEEEGEERSPSPEEDDEDQDQEDEDETEDEDDKLVTEKVAPNPISEEEIVEETSPSTQNYQINEQDFIAEQSLNSTDFTVDQSAVEDATAAFNSPEETSTKRYQTRSSQRLGQTKANSSTKKSTYMTETEIDSFLSQGSPSGSIPVDESILDDNNETGDSRMEC